MPEKTFFSLQETAILSMLGGLIFVLDTLFSLPLHIPGSSGIWWVIPVIVGVSIVKRPGAGLYIGLISGLLATFFGSDPLHVFDLFKSLALGGAVDLTTFLLIGRLDLIGVGFVVGAGANLAKMAVNYGVHLLFGIQAQFILLGIGISSVTHLVFGGLGGVLAVLLVRRLEKAGVIRHDQQSA
jgi:ABC-type thiamin/hydroxymethylpyrimidine transport system permease subunit